MKNITECVLVIKLDEVNGETIYLADEGIESQLTHYLHNAMKFEATDEGRSDAKSWKMLARDLIKMGEIEVETKGVVEIVEAIA